MDTVSPHVPDVFGETGSLGSNFVTMADAGSPNQAWSGGILSIILNGGSGIVIGGGGGIGHGKSSGVSREIRRIPT